MNDQSQILPTYFTVQELSAAKLIGLEMNARNLRKYVDKNNWRKKTSPDGQSYARNRQGRGGGWEYHINLLEPHQRRELARKWFPAAVIETKKPTNTNAADQWEIFIKKTAKNRNKAEDRFRCLLKVIVYQASGETKDKSCDLALIDYGYSKASIYNWFKRVEGVDQCDWLPFLVDSHKGKSADSSKCSKEAWEAFVLHYYRLEKPPATAAYENIFDLAVKNGWDWPSLKVVRRMMREFDGATAIALREGDQAIHDAYPAQRRTKDHLHALQSVQADGHMMDVWVEWHDGTIIRPLALVISDIYSNKIMGYKIDKSESATSVRMAFYHVFSKWGIPESVTFDNGRAFASKEMTGGQANRYRFKKLKGDVDGVLTALDVRVDWTTVYNGQAKPIERTFKIVCDYVSKAPEFAGAYTGNSATNKPDYQHDPRTKAVSYDLFMAVFEARINKLNAKEGRRTGVCAGKLSYDQAFDKSYKTALIKKASDTQLRLSMMAVKRVKTHYKSGEVKVLGNRYWAEFLVNHRRVDLTVRYDPDNLHNAVDVYDEEGRFLGYAECVEDAGFHSKEAARVHNKNRRDFKKAAKVMTDFESKMTLSEYYKNFPEIGAPPSAPTTKVVRMIPPFQVQPRAAEPEFHEDKEGVISMVELSAAMRRIKEAEKK